MAILAVDRLAVQDAERERGPVERVPGHAGECDSHGSTSLALRRYADHSCLRVRIAPGGCFASGQI
jgi:hypothetical protein